MSFSIVIPTCTVSNVLACVKRLRQRGQAEQVIVVWDDSFPFPQEGEAIRELWDLQPLQVWHADRPFCFAKSANIGIGAAGKDDVVLLNDDVLLDTPQGFSFLSAFVAKRGDAAIVSAAVRGAAHAAHWISGEIDRPAHRGEYAPREFVPFPCVYISRALIDSIGILDESFVPGGFEDNDYCHRARHVWAPVGTYYMCVVDHETLPHTFRPKGKADKYELAMNRKRFIEKWGGEVKIL